MFHCSDECSVVLVMLQECQPAGEKSPECFWLMASGVCFNQEGTCSSHQNVHSLPKAGTDAGGCLTSALCYPAATAGHCRFLSARHGCAKKAGTCVQFLSLFFFSSHLSCLNNKILKTSMFYSFISISIGQCSSYKIKMKSDLKLRLSSGKSY